MPVSQKKYNTKISFCWYKTIDMKSSDCRTQSGACY